MKPQFYKWVKRSKTRFLQVLLLIFSAVAVAAADPVIASAPASIAAADITPNRVLLLFSLHDDAPWQAGMRKGVADALQHIPLPQRPVLFEERLDAARLSDQIADQELAQFLAKKYQKIRFDIVIAEGQNANNFILAYPDLFPAVPRYHINFAMRAEQKISANSAFISLPDNLAKGIGTILTVMPETKKIITVMDGSLLGKKYAAQVRQLTPSLQNKAEIEIWNDFSMDELLTRAARLGRGTALFYLPVFRDRLGVKTQPLEVAKQLSKAAGAPVFTYFDTLLNTGVVGGYLLSAEQVGRSMVDIMRNSQRGKAALPPSALQKSAPYGYYFDSKQLQRWQIPDSQLPTPHTIINREKTTFQIYRWYIIGAAVFILLEGLLIAWLLRVTRQKTGALDALDRERNLLEVRVRERTHALQRKQEKLLEIQRIAGLGYWTLHLDTNRISWNAQFAALLDIDAQTTPSIELFRQHVHPDDAAMVLRTISDDAARQDGEKPHDFEYRMLNSDGGTRDIQSKITVLRDADGKAQKITGIVQDISERKRVEHLKSEFISTVSHELRTPLTSIHASLGLIAGGIGGELPPKSKSLIDIAYRNSNNLISLVNDILDMEKIEAGKMPFHLERLPLMPLLERALQNMAMYGKNLGVNYAVTAAVDDISVTVDEARLMQVLGNLLSNAAKHSGNSSQVDVAVQLQAGTRMVRVSVIDYGNGIPAEFRDRIFQKFSQAHASATRASGGTGLGLCITKAILEQMQGAIGFQSTPGEGSRFYFDLPTAD